MLRPLQFITRHTVALTALAIAGVIVAVVGVTRTQVGRDATARQLEASFAERFNGQLRIGALTGNLMREFKASDVRISDDSGSVALRIDSLVLAPSWSEILRRRFDARRLTLYGPEVLIDTDNDGRSNLQRIFSRSGADSSGGNWQLRTARVDVVDGEVIAVDARKSLDASPFWTSMGLASIQASLRLDATVDPLLIDLFRASARLPGYETGLKDASGQLAVTDSSLALTNARVELDETTLSLDASAARDQGDPIVQVNLQPSDVSFDEIRRLFPAFPLAGRGRVTLDAGGPISGLVVSRASVVTSAGNAEVSGYVIGLPDSAAFELDVAGGNLNAARLRRALPDMAATLNRARFDSLRVTSQISGRWTPDDSLIWRGQSSGRLGGGAGTLLWEVQGSLDRLGQATADADLDATSLRPERLVDWDGTPTLVTGTLQVSGAVTRGRLERLDADWQLADARVGASRLDRINGSARVGPEEALARSTLAQSAGQLDAEVRWDRLEQQAEVRWTARGLDLGPLLARSDYATAIHGTGRAELSLAGASRQLSALARVDSGRVDRAPFVGDLQPQTWAVIAESGPGGAALALESDFAALSVTSDTPPPGLRALLPFWREAFRDAWQREFDNPYPGTAPLLTDAAPPADLPSLRRRVLAAIGLAAATLRIEANLQDATPLQAWTPGRIPWDGSLQSSLDITASADSISSKLALAGDSLRVGAVRMDTPSIEWSGAASAAELANRAVRFDLEGTAASAAIRGTRLELPRVKLGLDGSAGYVNVTSADGADIGPLRFEAMVALLPDRARLSVEETSLSARNFVWRVAGTPSIDLYSNAIAVDLLELRSLDVERQVLRVDGVFSELPTDTLTISAERIGLSEVSRFGSITPELGGRLNARIALTGGADATRALGFVQVGRFQIGDDLIGDAGLSTRVIPGSNDIGVSLRVEPSPIDTLQPHLGRRLDNALLIEGRVRPSGADAFGTPDPGIWELDVDARRLEMFFLEYIFNTAIDRFDGFAQGGGRVTGTFAKPVFDLDFAVRDVAFGVPVTNVSYTAEGRVRVDQNAIRIEDTRISDAVGGAADLRGALLFNDYQFFSLDIAAELADLQIMDLPSSDTLPFYGHIRGSGSAFLTGPIADATLRIPNGVTRNDSEIYIPIEETIEETDQGFIIFADSSGVIPDLDALIRRPNVISRRAEAERKFVDGLNMDLNIFAPPGSTIYLVIDPLLGDVIRARGSGRVQLVREQGLFQANGELAVSGGDYLFTAGEVFVRRFLIEDGGTITWDGDPINARLNIAADYRTRASLAGLDNVPDAAGALVPLVVDLQITGRVQTPTVGLSLSIDRSNQNVLGDYQALEAQLNQPARATEYATSVLLTNSFQLTTESLSTRSGEQLAFNSVSQLVSAQLNRFLNATLPNVDFTLGLQGERAQDLDITYGVALRLLDERLIIRGQGLYQGSRTDATRVASESLQGEFVVEVRLNPSVSVEVFFRREGDILQSAELTNTAGAGLSYQAEFTSWRRFLRAVFGWAIEDRDPETEDPQGQDDPDREPIYW